MKRIKQVENDQTKKQSNNSINESFNKDDASNINMYEKPNAMKEYNTYSHRIHDMKSNISADYSNVDDNRSQTSKNNNDANQNELKDKNIEEEPEDKVENQTKVNMPFNNNILMIIIACVNILNGFCASYYAFTIMFFFNNPNYYKKHVKDTLKINELSSTELNLRVRMMNENKIEFTSAINTYLILGFLQIICGFIAFLIRKSRNNWNKDMISYIIYESIGNISSLGCVVLWFNLSNLSKAGNLVVNVNADQFDCKKCEILVLKSFQIGFKYICLTLSFISLGFKCYTFKMSFSDYLDLVKIEDLEL